MASGVTLTDNAFALFIGSKQDREDVLAIHQAYLDANTNDLSEEQLRVSRDRARVKAAA